MYIYPSHFNCVGAVSVVSSPYYEPHSTGLTTRRSRRDRARQSKWSRPGPRGIGPTRRRSTCEKDRARAEMEREWYVVSMIVLESERKQRDTRGIRRE